MVIIAWSSVLHPVPLQTRQRPPVLCQIKIKDGTDHEREKFQKTLQSGHTPVIYLGRDNFQAALLEQTAFCSRGQFTIADIQNCGLLRLVQGGGG
ncbi:hypothetical protein PILCRDRAFT_382365 [Piloderma croceum F 1598]|uniref:Uncharacterized protein n=1 Tax=Piloderma croceum (strain F 1598) TaxID=765440 RepID=A0A0C3BDM5_PILCF|nr:hypothetical protein PILCRDRAFT_382365 [Piloderma croceum F 1598]